MGKQTRRRRRVFFELEGQDWERGSCRLLEGEGEGMTIMNALAFLGWNITSLSFLDIFSGLLDLVLSFMVYGCYLLHFLWDDSRVAQLCFNFTMHQVGVLFFCFQFHGILV